MLPRRLRLSNPQRTLVQPADPMAADSFRPTMTGSFPRHRSTPSGATPIGSLPDALSFVHEEDGDAPHLGLL